MKRRALAIIATALAWSGHARAVDVTKGDDPVRLDVTETTVVAQHFNARDAESPADSGYGAWLNRVNATLSWQRWTVGTRLDSALYWSRPVDGADVTPQQETLLLQDEASRYRNSLYPAKLWATYAAPGLEVTLGDAYVQFGRGLLLSMRKIDALGIDTTLRGAKAEWQGDPFAATVVAGIANPSRVDEATGRALFLPLPTTNDGSRGPQPLFGSDRIVGAEIQAGRGLPVTLTTHAVRITRCAPYAYDATGRVIDDTFTAPLGSCVAADTSRWLSSIGSSAGPMLSASEVDMVGQGLEVPDLWGHGQIYLEGAVQHRVHDGFENDRLADGNALYGSASVNFGPVTETLEVKSYRNFYPVAAAVDLRRAVEFNNVVYSTPPTAELITQDAEFGFFNACVDGGRLRTDVRTSKQLLLYATGAYFHTKSEQASGGCDQLGHVVAGGTSNDAAQDYVEDAIIGEELYFEQNKSHLFAWGGVRNDEIGTGELFYREFHVDYAFTKHISGPYSIELQGRHRLRYENTLNLDSTGAAQYWHEGENYTAFKVSPKWVFTQGFEYTTLTGLPTYWFNGGVLYQFSGGSNLRLFGGQQRPGLKCVSGVCKIFPAFEGVRAELTVRF